MPTRLAYDIHGEGTPVVLLHGLTFDRSVWRPIEERLGDGIQSIAFDLPGHGESTGEPGTLGDVAEAIHRTLGELGIHDPVLVGHSISAVISLIYAASHPVRGVIDVDQRLNPRPFAELLQRIAPALRGEDFRTAFQPFQDGMGIDRLPEPARSEVLARQTIDRDLVLSYWDELLSGEPTQMQARTQGLMTGFDAPFLGIFTHELAPEERHFLLDRLRNAELEEWTEGGSHLVFLAEPDRFAARVREFVAQTA